MNVIYSYSKKINKKKGDLIMDNKVKVTDYFEISSPLEHIPEHSSYYETYYKLSEECELMGFDCVKETYIESEDRYLYVFGRLEQVPFSFGDKETFFVFGYDVEKRCINFKPSTINVYLG